MTALARPPTSERGSVRPDLAGWSRLPGWSDLALSPAEHEHVLALQWPQAIDTYTSMLSDPQVWALVQAVGLPVQRYRFALHPNGMDEERAALLADDIDLPLAGQDVSAGRDPTRLSHRRLMTRALSALNVGHAVFELVGEIDQAGRWRLVDLAPRPARTLTRWMVDRQGRLEWIEQTGSGRPVRLDAGRLAIWTWQGEPGDPRGRSMLRPLYRPWLAKDRLARIDMLRHERNSMGIPIGWAAEGATQAQQEQLERLLANLAAGEETNLTLPHGSDVKLLGVQGQTSDVVGSMRYHDEQMTRAMLAMVIQLGTTAAGSRALGETHEGLLRMFHDVVVQWHADVLTTQVCARWVAWNDGPDAPVGRVVWERDEHEGDSLLRLERAERAGLAMQRMGLAARYGIVSPAEAREISGLDELDGDPPAHPVMPAVPGEARAVEAAGRRHDSRATTERASVRRPTTATAVVNGVPVPDRRLRRQPTQLEAQAGVDFARIDQEWTGARDELTELLVAMRDDLATIAVDHIADMDQVDAATVADELGPLLADTVRAAHADAATAAVGRALLGRLRRTLRTITSRLVEAAQAGAGQVVDEAARQGVRLDPVDVAFTERAAAEALDLAQRMGRQVADSAASATRVAAPAGAAGVDVADAVAEHVAGLTDALPEQAASGATSRATNSGRTAAIEQSPYRSVYASELLDGNTCDRCREIDGTTYSSLEEAMADYPAGGYRDCEGGERCRGLLVAVHEGEQEAAT